MGRFWEWNHGHQDGNMLVHMNISDDGGAHSRSIHYTIFHDGRAELIVIPPPGVGRVPAASPMALVGPNQPGRSVGRPAHPGPSLFFPESERTRPAVGGRPPHSTARGTVPGHSDSRVRARARGGGCRRGAVT